MSTKKVRYAVVGLGHIAQAAVLPAFKNASENSELTAFISSDPDKLKELSPKYGVDKTWSYEEYDKALASKTFDAVYIALPNDMHRDFSVRAAKAGVHVLCEKPMAVTADDCMQMISAAEQHNVKLMIAYRLHFEETNMTAVDLIRQGKIGMPRYFNSSFSMQIKDNNVRTDGDKGGGPLYDIGIYCINAARYLFQSEPLEVMAFATKRSEPRFSEIEETLSGMLKFPGEKIAVFVCSFGAGNMSRYEIVGTKGSITLDPAYEYPVELEYVLKVGDKEERHKTPKRDQFAPELIHFSECVLENKTPRPSGDEGLNDLRVIEALQDSARHGRVVRVKTGSTPSKPDRRLVIEKPGVSKPHLVKVEASSQ